MLSFDDFYRAQFPSVFRAVFATSGDPEAAADAAQEAFKRAFIHWRRVSRHPSPGGWVMTTALNALRREMKRRNWYRRIGRQMPDAAFQPDADRLDVVRAISALPPRQQQAVVLYYIGDLSTAQVADVMAISEGTVKAHLAQARANLEPMLEGSYA